MVYVKKIFKIVNVYYPQSPALVNRHCEIIWTGRANIVVCQVFTCSWGYNFVNWLFGLGGGGNSGKIDFILNKLSLFCKVIEVTAERWWHWDCNTGRFENVYSKTITCLLGLWHLRSKCPVFFKERLTKSGAIMLLLTTLIM